MNKTAHRAAIGLLGAAILGHAASAAAQASAADKALAESLFQESKKLMKDGKVAEACPKLVESYRIVPKLGTLLNLATCHEQEGKTASAWAEFTEATSLATKSKETARVQYAHDHLQDLEKRLSRLLIEASSADKDVEVKLDGKVIGAAVLGTAISIDPGDHEVTATAPGKKPWTTTAKVAPGPVTVKLQVPALEKDGAAAGTAPPPPPAKVEPPPPGIVAPPPQPEGSSGTGQRVAGIVMMGAGAVGLGVGTAFGLMTFSRESESNKHCNGILCDQEGVNLRKDAHTSATISTVAFIAGGVLAAGGLVVTLTAGRSKKAAAGGRIWLAPEVGRGGSRVTLGGAF